PGPMNTLLRLNLGLLVVLAVVLGATKILGLDAQRELYQSVGLFGTPLAAFGFAQLGSGVLIASLPTRRIGAGIFIGAMLVTAVVFQQNQLPLQALAALAVLSMPVLVLSSTPRVVVSTQPVVGRPRVPRRA
ncbi:MAG: hypothetical protein AAF721_39200, partial [Myxococcota bacterium]